MYYAAGDEIRKDAGIRSQRPRGSRLKVLRGKHDLWSQCRTCRSPMREQRLEDYPLGRAVIGVGNDDSELRGLWCRLLGERVKSYLEKTVIEVGNWMW